MDEEDCRPGNVSMENETYHVDDSAWIHETVEIGRGSKIWNWSKVREHAKIGENCVIGQCVYIDMGVMIGNACKIQNGAQVYHGVTLGNSVFVGPNVTFSNDKYPRAFNGDWTIIRTSVEEGASIGAGAVIVCGVTIGKYSMVAAGSLVTQDVPDYGLVKGQPARLVDYVNRMGIPIGHDMSKPFCEDEGI